MKNLLQIVLFSALCFISYVPNAGAQSSPTLYPNAKAKSLSPAQLGKIVGSCEASAKAAVGVGNEKAGSNVVRGAAKGAALGALAGTITKNNTGRSAGAGAAVGGTAAVLGNAKAKREGSPEYRAYVTACLDEQGLKVVGWK